MRLNAVLVPPPRREIEQDHSSDDGNIVHFIGQHLDGALVSQAALERDDLRVYKRIPGTCSRAMGYVDLWVDIHQSTNSRR